MNYYLRPQGSSERLFISNIIPSSEPEYQFTATADLFNIKASKNVLVSVRVSSNLYEANTLCHLMLNCPKFKLQVMHKSIGNFAKAAKRKGNRMCMKHSGANTNSIRNNKFNQKRRRFSYSWQSKRASAKGSSRESCRLIPPKRRNFHSCLAKKFSAFCFGLEFGPLSYQNSDVKRANEEKFF